MVRAIDVRTAGLGGDSELRRHAGALTLGPRRVVPLCLLAHQHPGIQVELERQAARGQAREHDGGFLLRRMGSVDSPSLGTSARRTWDLLASGPVAMEEIVERQHLGLAAARLIDRGLAIAAGFTPTDAAHLLGRQHGWSVEAARLGAELAARRLGDGEAPLQFARRVLDLAGMRTGELLLEAALAADGEAADELTRGLAGRLVARGLAVSGDEVGPATLVRARFELALPVVAVGGPAPLFCPAPVARLGASLTVPPLHATANAVGAVVGRVERSARVTLATVGEQAWRVHLPEGGRDVGDLESAVSLAESAARAAARNAARLAGCPDPVIVVERTELTYADAVGAQRTLRVTIEARAVGRPALGERG
jgi:N-methylhydantoinase A/oxoprolinase/acetone carboxylase beta subunit